MSKSRKPKSVPERDASTPAPQKESASDATSPELVSPQAEESRGELIGEEIAEELAALGLHDDNIDEAFAELVGEIRQLKTRSRALVGGAVGIVLGLGIGVFLLTRRSRR